MKYKSSNSRISKKLINQKYTKLNDYRKKLRSIYKSNEYEESESSINLPFDKKYLFKISYLTKKYSFAKNIIVIGIGGANLGCKAIYDTFKNERDLKNILFLDTINPSKFTYLLKNKKKFTQNNTAIILISQSGKTTESIVNAEIMYRYFPKLKKNTIIISNNDSALSKFAVIKNLDHIKIPLKVGGRYSVFSPIALLPLALCGLNINKLQLGAKKAVISGISLKVNIAQKSAVISHLCNSKYYNIHNTFIFEPQLEEVGKWIRQLTAESLGKDKDGILPIYTIGSVDLHSVYQLFLQGPKNVYTNFVKIEKNNFDLKITKKVYFKNLVQDLEGKNIQDIFNAIYLGVKRSYKKNKLPYCEYILEKLDEESLGFFMQTKMIETMYMGNLMNINAFNQPGVEEYKKETRQILKNL